MKAHVLALTVVPLLAALTAWTAFGQLTTATLVPPAYPRSPAPPSLDRQGPDQGTLDRGGGRAGSAGQEDDPDPYAGYSIDVDGDQITLHHRSDPAQWLRWPLGRVLIGELPTN
ncbi:hypothetical protein [Micromonospora sp. NBC_01796]|uniref:hypothetical protein n=1 Tax=Micromonospora sp. NBC_01796 TaxID=2975987 RepID=UPI002DDBFCE8|nr:hypothetical protein [Micromonospora sp. NBC_01796]WSA84518.1 hypothetical protein OIE47_29800 [Micromonospora sp. NBC_01796]